MNRSIDWVMRDTPAGYMHMQGPCYLTGTWRNLTPKGAPVLGPFFIYPGDARVSGSVLGLYS